MDYALTDKDLSRFGRVVLYKQLATFKDVDRLLKNGVCFILYNIQSDNSGHWTCLTKRNRHTLDYFDSYGWKPDTNQKKYSDRPYVDNYLSMLLKKSPYDIHYNDVDYQKMDDDIATCGRHCLYRSLNKELNEEQYKKKLDAYGEDYDQLIVELTRPIIGK